MNLEMLCLENPVVGYNGSFTNCPVAHPNKTGGCGLPLYPGVIENGEGWLMRQYRIEGFIAEGGQARVYKATRRNIENVADTTLLPIAIKALKLDNSNTDELKEAVERFEHEALLLTRLKHTNLVELIGYQNFPDGRAFMVLEYVQGECLENVAKRGLLPWQEVVHYAAQLCDVLEYLHSQKDTAGRPLVYRDVKPDNIMLPSNGLVKLCDLGITRHSSGKTKQTQIGSPGYAPLEQYQGLAEPRSDQYALGVTIHRLITGKEPIPFTALEDIRVTIPGAPEYLAIAIAKATQMHAANRFSTISDFRDAITNKLMITAPASKPRIAIASSLQVWTPPQDIKYEVVRINASYGRTLEELRTRCFKDPRDAQPTIVLPDGTTVKRPLTFKETIKARIDDLETLHAPDGSLRTEDERKKLFTTYLDTCTGIAYQAGTSRAKIVPACLELIQLPPKFGGAYFPVDFSQLQGAEIKTNATAEALWIEALEADTQFYRTYKKLMHQLTGMQDVMRFWTRQKPDKDELRALFVVNLLSNSNAYGSDNLDSSLALARVAHAKNFP